MAEEEQLRRLARGGIGGLAGGVVSGLAGLAFVVVVARGLDAEQVGAVFALTSLFLVTLAVLELGTDVALVRFLALRLADRGPAAASAVLPVVLVPVLGLATAAAVVLALLGPHATRALLDEPGVGAATVLLAVLVPVAVASDLLLAATRGLGSVRPTIVVDGLLRQGLQPVLALVALSVSDGVVAVVAAWSAPYVVSALAGAGAVRRLARRHGLRSTAVDRALLRATAVEVWLFAAPRSLTQVAQTAVRRADIPIVAALAGPAAAALYTTASRIVALGQLGIRGIQQMVGPQVARLLGQDRPAAAVVVLRTATAWSVVIAWPVYLAAAAVPEHVMAVFGPGYAEGAPVLVVLALAMLVGTGAGPVDIVLLMAGRSVASLVNNVAALLTNVALLVVLVPRWGATGAAVAWAAAIVVGNALPAAQVARTLHAPVLDRRVVVAALLALATVGVPAGGCWLAGAGLAERTAVLAAGLLVHAALLVSFRHHLRLPELLGAFLRRGPRPA